PCAPSATGWRSCSRPPAPNATPCTGGSQRCRVPWRAPPVPGAWSGCSAARWPPSGACAPAETAGPPRGTTRGRHAPAPVRSVLQTQLAADDQLLDLAGALGDRGQLGVAVVALHRVLGDVAVAAV